MNVKDYKFEIGDEVITTKGKKGKIIDVCNCESCQRRGFHEPVWIREEDGVHDYITIYQAQTGFGGYHRIGKYIFNDFDKSKILESMMWCEKELGQLKKQLEFIESVEKEEAKEAISA